MPNPRLTVEFLPNGSSTVKFSSIDGITPGKVARAAMQARKELVRLCALAGVEMRRKRTEEAAEQARLIEEAREVAEARSPSEEEVPEVEDEEVPEVEDEEV